MGDQPAEHAILGLLRLGGGAAHGYELMRRFAAPDPLADILHLSQPMLYQLLKKLTRSGWLRIEIEPQETRPPRQMCHLTEAGQQELERWLGEPVGHTREIRLEFLVKLYFAQLLDPARARTLLLDQHTVCERWRDSLSRQLAALGDEPATAPSPAGFRRQVLSLRLAQTTAAMSWLDTLLQTDEITPIEGL